MQITKYVVGAVVVSMLGTTTTTFAEQPGALSATVSREATRLVAEQKKQEDQPTTPSRSHTLFTSGVVLAVLGTVSVSLAGTNTNLCPTSTSRYALVQPCPAEGANLRLIGGLGLLGAGVAMMIAGKR